MQVDARNPNGATPLLRACWKGHLDVARLLLQKGADPAATLNDGGTTLICAAANHHHELLTMLSALPGVDLCAANEDGWTALKYLQQPMLDPVGLRIILAAMERRGVLEAVLTQQLGFPDDVAAGVGPEGKQQRLRAVLRDVDGSSIIEGASSPPAAAAAGALSTAEAPAAAGGGRGGISMADLLPLPLKEQLWKLSQRGRGAEAAKGVPWCSLGKVVLHVSNPLLPAPPSQRGGGRRGSSRSSPNAGSTPASHRVGKAPSSSSSSSSIAIGSDVDYYCFHVARFSTISKQLAAKLGLPVLSKLMIMSGESYGHLKDPLDNAATGEGGMEQPVVLARFTLGGRHWLSVCTVLAEHSKPTGDCFSMPNFLGVPDLEMLLDAQWLLPPSSAHTRGEELDLAAYFGPQRLTGFDHDYIVKRPLDLHAIKAVLTEGSKGALLLRLYIDLVPFSERAARTMGLETPRMRIDPSWSGPCLCSREFAEDAARNMAGMQLLREDELAAMSSGPADDGDGSSDDDGDGVTADERERGQDAAYRLRWKAAILLHFMICHSNKCHRPRTSSCHKEQRGGTEYG